MTFTNHRQVILDQLTKLIKNEFNMPVVLGNEFQPKQLAKGIYFRIEFTTDEWIESYSDGETRDYLIDIFLYVDGKEFERRRDYNEWYNTYQERMRALSVTNRSYTVDEIYYWHNWRVVEISPPVWVGDLEEGFDDFTDVQAVVFNNIIQRSNN